MDLPLPPKKVFGNMDREFIAERQQALQKYLNLLLMHHLLSGSIYFKKFLDPSRYPAEMQGENKFFVLTTYIFQWNEDALFMRISQPVSRITVPNIGMFVLILKYFPC